MMIDTKTWGTLEIQESQRYHFHKGIPGFEEETEFVLLPVENEPFSYLQSPYNKELAFLLADPFQFYPNYEFDLPDEEAEELGIDQEVIVRCVLTLKEQIELSSINLLAPLVLNPQKLTGKQIVLHKTPYQTRHALWLETSAEKAGE